MADFTELGSTGLRRSGGQLDEEFLTLLKGDSGRRFLREMADNSPIAGAILFGIENIIKQVGWRIDPAEVDENDRQAADKALTVAMFVESTKDDMAGSWDDTISDICSMFVYGWSLLEIVYKRRAGEDKDPVRTSAHADGMIGWGRWAPRAQDTLLEWMFDEAGNVTGMKQLDPYQTGGGAVTIPIDKALLFRTTSTKGNPEGRPLLRNAVQSWYFQKRIMEIEAIGIERDLAGLPVAWVPHEWMASDAGAEETTALAAAQELIANVKRNEQEGVLLPSMVDLETGTVTKIIDLQLLSTGGQRAFDAQPLSAKVLTPTGWRTMGEIRVGDEVIDPLGQPSRVEGVFPKGTRPVYRVTLQDGRTTLADARHKWVVTNSKWSRRPRVKDAHSDQLPTYKVLRTHEIAEWMERHPHNRMHLPLMAEVEFRQTGGPLPVDPYVLGALLGDGTMPARGRGGPRLYCADPEIARRVEDGLPRGDFMTVWHDKDSGSGAAEMYRISGTGTRGRAAISDALAELGLAGHTAATKFVPTAYLWAGVKDRLHLLQGLCDTDGTVSKKGAVVFSTCSTSLRDDVMTLVRSLGGTASATAFRPTSYRQPKTGQTVELLDGVTHYQVSIRLPDHLAPVSLPRKVERLRPDDRTRYHTGIRSIEYVGDEPVQCIYVSADSHMYVTDDFIPTHNTDKVITRYEQRIAMAVLMDFLLLGHEQVGSYSLGLSKMKLWAMAVDSIAAGIAEVVNTQAIPQLLRLNGLDPALAPKLAFSGAAQTDVEQLSTAIQRLLTSGAILPDPALEAYTREEFGLPPREAETTDL